MPTKENNSLNLPALKKPNTGIAKTAEKKRIEKFDLENVKRKSQLSSAVKQTSIKQEMKKQQQLHKGLDLVLVGDLTGSMSSYHQILKSKFNEICSTLFQIIPNLRIGIIFYLDHGSGDPYVTKVQGLTVNIEKLQHFINTTRDGSGGDADEAVEDALHDALLINWNENNIHSVVLFGDAGPHESNSCPHGYDYFEIAHELYKNNVTVNTVFCSNGYDSKKISTICDVEIGNFKDRISHLGYAAFFSWLANVTGGVAIGAEQIDDIIDIIKALAAKDAGKMEEFEEEEKKIKTKFIPALEHIKKRAKEIEEKKKILGIGYDG